MTNSWMDSALCAEIGGDDWFPEIGGENGKRAKQICASCNVVQQCLEYALTHGITEGIWGGQSPQERAKLRRPNRLYPNLIVGQRTVEWADVVSAYEASVPVAEIAGRFGISQRSVYRIVAESRAA